MEGSGVWSPIRGRNANQDILWLRLRVLDHNIKVTILGKNACIYQLIFWLLPSSSPILSHQIIIGEGALRILIERLHIRMGWSIIQIVIIFFDILSVIALWTTQTKEPLLENGVSAIPQAESETEAALPITDAQQTILAPTIDAGASMIVRKRIPGGPGG